MMMITACLIALKKSSVIKDRENKITAVMLLAIVSLLVMFIFMFSISSIILGIINQEFGALQFIIEGVK